MRSLSEIEQVIQEEFDAMPESFRDENATEFYLFMNAMRRSRFNVPCEECDDCGYAFPKDDVTLVCKSDGRGYWVCTSCRDFGKFVRAIFKDRAA